MGTDAWQQKLIAAVHFAARQKASLVDLWEGRRTQLSRALGRTRKSKGVSTWQDGTTHSVNLRIYNKGSSVVEAFWVKYDGDLQQYGTIKPGGMLSISSYNTHAWCLRVAGKGDLHYMGESAALCIQPRGKLHVELLGPDTSDDHVDQGSWMRPEWGQYRQQGSVRGLPIMAYDCVGQAAVDQCACCITHMMATADLAVMKRIQQAGCKLAIIARQQVTTDIPPHHFMKRQAAEGGRDIDATTRGLGATHAVPTASCGEENITMINDTRYFEESILVHEFAHAVMNLGFDETQMQEIHRLYKQALEQGIYRADCYMMDNAEEYWAEGSQVWFGATVRTDVTSGVNTRELLQQHDPELCRLMQQVYGPNAWQYTNTCPGRFRTPCPPLYQHHHQQHSKSQVQQPAAAGASQYSLRWHQHLLPTNKHKTQQDSRRAKDLLPCLGLHKLKLVEVGASKNQQSHDSGWRQRQQVLGEAMAEV